MIIEIATFGYCVLALFHVGRSSSCEARSIVEQRPKRVKPPTDQLVERFGERYGLRDKVMHIVNDREPEMYNGAFGVITGSVTRTPS